MSDATLLWAPEDTRAAFVDFAFVRELNLHVMFPFHTVTHIGERDMQIQDFFTLNPHTICLRQEMLFELLDQPALYEHLRGSFVKLEELFNLQKEKDASLSEHNEKLLFGILEMEAYVAYMEDIREIFSAYPVKSQLLQGLWQILEPLCTGSSFEQLREEVRQQVNLSKNIRSISIGINLDSQLRPLEAGVLDIHDTYFMSGDLMDRLLRLDMKTDAYTCKAPLYPMIKKVTPQEANAMRMSVNSALNKVFASALRSWSGVVKKYVMQSLRELAPLLSEWRFISVCTDVLQKVKQHGYPLCRAIFGHEDCVLGMYHPILVLSHLSDAKRDIVKNDVHFGSDTDIYILTGPNQGGKSIYTQAVGILYAMLHLGLPLPADSAVVRPVDAILTHFIDTEQLSYRHGRLSGECDRIYKINQVISKHSLFLFDEALSSTNATEAVAISSEIIRAYAVIGAHGIWTTHFHELCQLSEESVSGQAHIGNLVARMDEASHTRQFHILPGDSYAPSYATDIARMYKLSKEEIVKSAAEKRETCTTYIAMPPSTPSI